MREPEFFELHGRGREIFHLVTGATAGYEPWMEPMACVLSSTLARAEHLARAVEQADAEGIDGEAVDRVRKELASHRRQAVQFLASFWPDSFTAPPARKYTPRRSSAEIRDGIRGELLEALSPILERTST